MYTIKALEVYGKTIWRVVERKRPTDPWLVTLPCIDYDQESDAKWKLRELQGKEGFASRRV